MNDQNTNYGKTAAFSLKAAVQPFVALLGFVLGTCFVLSNSTAFHEIEYEPKLMVRQMLTDDSVVIDKSLNRCVSCDNKKDSCMRDTISQEINYRLYLLRVLSDSALDRALVSNQLSINANDFDDSALVYFHFDTMAIPRNQPILWDYYLSYSLLYNKPVTPYRIQKYEVPKAVNFPTFIDFFTEYPGFILWALLIILQFTILPVLILYAWDLIYKFRCQFQHLCNTRAFWVNLVLSGIVIGIFVITSYVAFFNPNLITNNLFYKKMTPVLLTVGSLSGIIGMVCFTGFILIAGTDIKAKADTTDEEEKEYLVSMYNEMNALFINLLLISSIVLSSIVLTTGVLFTSINSMDFIQKLSGDLGYTPLAYHYVILIAVLSSLLLALFFIPAKLHLLELGKSIRKFDPDGKLTDKSPDLVKILQGLIVAGLPIITGIVHSFIAAFINN